jgi:hypothetical protein
LVPLFGQAELNLAPVAGAAHAGQQAFLLEPVDNADHGARAEKNGAGKSGCSERPVLLDGQQAAELGPGNLVVLAQAVRVNFDGPDDATESLQDAQFVAPFGDWRRFVEIDNVCRSRGAGGDRCFVLRYALRAGGRHGAVPLSADNALSH